MAYENDGNYKIAVGDAVRFIGFEHLRKTSTELNEHKDVGIVLKVYRDYRMDTDRFDVLWPNGRIGKALFLETLELVSIYENR